MGYHNVRLPETFSEGSQFGPGFSTRIIELDSMAEHRIRRGPDAGRRTYSLEQGVNSLDALYTLYKFYIARGGAENSFRLKDWLDYATNSTGTTHRVNDPAVAFSDQDLVLVSGNTYQFVKRYVSGPTTIVRTLRKLVSGTVHVGDHSGGGGSGVELVAGFTLDLENGQVTFSVAPTGQVTGGCEFDVVARFSQETDRAFLVAIKAVDTGDLPSILCVEDVDPVVVSQDYPHGGAKNHGAIGADVTLSEFDGRQQTAEPTTAGKSFVLPSFTSLPTGGVYFVLMNNGSQNMNIKDSGGATVTSLNVGVIKQVWLGLTAAGSKVWIAF